MDIFRRQVLTGGVGWAKVRWLHLMSAIVRLSMALNWWAKLGHEGGGVLADELFGAVSGLVGPLVTRPYFCCSAKSQSSHSSAIVRAFTSRCDGVGLWGG